MFKGEGKGKGKWGGKDDAVGRLARARGLSRDQAEE